MNRYTRSVVVGLAIVFAAGCGSEGEQGPPGEASEVTTERFEEHDDCEAGGVEIIVDGEVSDVLCDGEAGEAAPAPEISIDQDPSECGDAGGVAVTIGDEDPFTLCNGEDGTGEGEVPDISIGDPEDCGDAGGYSLEIGDEDPIDICHGEDGAGGEGGADIEIEEIEPSETGPCLEGGLEITVTDSEGDEETFTICGVAPIEAPEIGWCNTSYPDSIEMFDDEVTTVYGEIYVEDFTGDQPGTLPEDDYVAELGYVEAAEDPDDDVDPTDGDWDWLEAEINEDFENGNNDEFEAEFSDVDAGEYYYLYRMSIDGGDEWVYCGLEGNFDTDDYDASEDAGWMDVAVAPTMIAGWDFEASSLDVSRGEDSDAYAMFSDGDENDPVGSSVFYGPGGSHWVGQGFWSTEDEFPPSDFEDLEYFEFNSEMFSEYAELTVNGEFRRTSTGPTQVQIVAEFDDGALAMLDEAIQLESADNNLERSADVSPDALVAIDDDPGAGAEIESFRVYGFDSDNFGGSENMRVIDIEFAGF